MTETNGINHALAICKLATSSAARGDVNGQYHWASDLLIDALARGAKGPQDMGAQFGTTGQLAGSTPAASTTTFEDAIEEARR